MSPGDWFSLLGVVGGLGGLFFGLYQYIQAQRWKRAELVATEMKEFKSLPAVKSAMLMLDWSSQEIELFPDEESAERRKIWVTDEMLRLALQPHTERADGKFTDTEAAIRGTFDEFLDGLERFEQYIQSGLVDVNDVRPYLDYWIEIMGKLESDRKPPEVKESLWRYIQAYDYRGVQRLFTRFGYDIRPRQD